MAISSFTSRDYVSPNMDKIYKLIDPITLLPRYIGFTSIPLQRRLENHIRTSLAYNTTHKERWIVSVLKQGKKPLIELVRYLPKSTPGTWDEWETYYIQKYRELGYDLTNGTGGGEGVVHPSEETREKIRQANRGHIMPNQTREALAKANKNRLCTPETRAKIGLKNKGKQRSEYQKNLYKELYSKPLIVTNGDKEYRFKNADEASVELAKLGVIIKPQRIRFLVRQYINPKKRTYNVKKSLWTYKPVIP